MKDEVLEFGEKFLQANKRSMEDNVLDIDDLDQEIYRIFSIKRFIQLMCSKELVLVNPSKWDDPFENFFLQANAIDSNGQIASLVHRGKKGSLYEHHCLSLCVRQAFRCSLSLDLLGYLWGYGMCWYSATNCEG